MKMALFLTMILVLHTNLSTAATIEILDVYQQTAEKLLVVLDHSTEQSVDTVAANALFDQLIAQGTETMNLIGEKKPECAQQFAVFISEIPQMMTMSVNDIHKRYHNGEGLPTAPKYCYFGRSQIVHPVMSKILLNNEWNAESREEVIDQTNEVIEHGEKIRKLIAL